MALPDFKELMAVDVTPYCKERDGIKYLPWAKCKELLHEHGAESVYFVPEENHNDGSSLRMSSRTFVDKKGVENRCYETKIIIHIDDAEFSMISPVMNGGNPVRDNSMSQQRVWNSMCRSFVKGVAIYTGLGFNLWAQSEGQEEFDAVEDNTKHDIRKVQERLMEKLTALNKAGLNVRDIAEKIGMTEDDLRAQFSYFSILYNLEKRLDGLL